jgi:hypothetical protein
MLDGVIAGTLVAPGVPGKGGKDLRETITDLPVLLQNAGDFVHVAGVNSGVEIARAFLHHCHKKSIGFDGG